MGAWNIPTRNSSENPQESPDEVRAGIVQVLLCFNNVSALNPGGAPYPPHPPGAGRGRPGNGGVPITTVSAPRAGPGPVLKC